MVYKSFLRPNNIALYKYSAFSLYILPPMGLLMSKEAINMDRQVSL
jgi:hypothetical protein